MENGGRFTIMVIEDSQLLAAYVCLRDWRLCRAKPTFVIVAHRVATLKDTDRVLVFEDGGIVEEGAYADLIAEKNSRFGQLHALQSASG